MNEKEQYLALMSEIISKQSDILGPDIAVLKARNVNKLTIADDGSVTDFKGNANEILQELVNQYVELSGLIVKNALGSIFEKYPAVKKVE